MREKDNQHEWGLVAVQRSPYIEYAYCPRCKRYRDSKGTTYTSAQFQGIVQLHRLFEPDSDRRITPTVV